MQQRANKLRRGTLQGVFSRVQLVRVVHPIIRAYHWGLSNLRGEGGSYESYSWGSYHLHKLTGWKSCA